MTPLLELRGLSKRFALRGSQGFVHAVDDVSFSLAPGECAGLVGESGCGKSTIARLVARFVDPSDGQIAFAGENIGSVGAAAFARSPLRSAIQMVFQDPSDSLNPRFTAFDSIAEPLRRLGPGLGTGELAAKVAEAAELAGLAEELARRYPHQLSGGQQQRLGIARAVALRPRLLVLDEPTSSLDVSVQALILRLLADLQRRLGMTYLFVSHDLNLIRLLCDRVFVMYLGRIVESGPVAAVFDRPQHPYTRALISAIPVLDPAARRQRIKLSGEPRSPIDPSPSVCRFFGRCPEGHGRCEQEMPLLRAAGSEGQIAACHLLDESTASAT